MNFKISSPAKINLGLKVLNKRKDNFHNIKTIFQFLDWGDKIYIENEVSETEIICKEIEHENNIIFELFRILKKETPTGYLHSDNILNLTDFSNFIALLKFDFGEFLYIFSLCINFQTGLQLIPFLFKIVGFVV